MYNYEILPAHMRDVMQRYIENRLEPGGFLRAVLENDLVGSVMRADEINLERMYDYCLFLYNEAPSICWGSPEKVQAWLDRE